MIRFSAAAQVAVANAHGEGRGPALSEEEVQHIAVRHAAEHNAEASSSSSESEVDPISPMRRKASDLLSTRRFQIVVGGVILVNVMMMLVMADYPDLGIWTPVNYGFLSFYSLELLLRVFAYRLSFLISFADDSTLDCATPPRCNESDLVWNRFDFVVVCCGWTDIVLRTFFGVDTPGPAMMVVRTVRLLRVVRVLRGFKSMRPLTNLIRGLLNSMVSIFWVLMLLITVMLVFAIFTTTQFGHNADKYTDDPEGMKEKWGCVWNSFRTLFSYLTLDDWSNMTREAAWPGPHMPLSPVVCTVTMFMLIFYVLLTAFVILSLLTGTMVEEMEKVRNDNDDELEDFRDKVRHSLDVFFNHYLSKCSYDANLEMIGLNEVGLIDLFKDPTFQRDLKALSVDVPSVDPKEAFVCFDLDGDGHLLWEEFSNGILALIAKKVSRKKFFKLDATMKSCLLLVEQGRSGRPKHVTNESCDATLAADSKKLVRRTHVVEKSMQGLHRDLDDLLGALHAKVPKRVFDGADDAAEDGGKEGPR